MKNQGLIYFLLHLIAVLLYQINLQAVIFVYPLLFGAIWYYLHKPVKVLIEQFMDNAPALLASYRCMMPNMNP